MFKVTSNVLSLPSVYVYPRYHTDPPLGVFSTQQPRNRDNRPGRPPRSVDRLNCGTGQLRCNGASSGRALYRSAYVLLRMAWRSMCHFSFLLFVQVWRLDGPDLANISQDTVRNDAVWFLCASDVVYIILGNTCIQFASVV